MFKLADAIRGALLDQNTRRGMGDAQQSWAKNVWDRADADYVKSNGRHPYVVAQDQKKESKPRGLGW